MFETSRRQHPLHTFRFWFVVVAAGSVTLAWKFDLLPVRIGPAATGDLASDTLTSLDPPLDAPESTNSWANDLPFAHQDSGPNVPTPVTTLSAAPRTAQVDSAHAVPVQSEPLFSAASPVERTQVAPFNHSTDNDWPHDAGTAQTATTPHTATSLPSASTTPIVQTNATATSFESPSEGTLPEPTVPPFPSESADAATATAAGIDLLAIDQLIATGVPADEIEAHRQLSTAYWQHPAARPALRDRVDRLSQQIYFLKGRHYMEPYQVQPGEMLQSIARQYDVTWQYLAKLNRVDPKRVRAGERLKVIKGPFSVVVDLSQYELTIHAHGYYVTRYPVGIGKDGSSPIGRFTVQEKLVDPTYYGPDGVVAHDDPNNPLGERWIDIGNSYGIHGTIDPASIGKSESKGCLRMHNEDVAAVYDLLTIGSEVIIRP